MNDTKTKILDLAESLTQTNGFNGFSYLDLAEEIGIKSASVHYHFKCKDDLAVALVERIHETHALAFQNLNAKLQSPKKRLEAVVDVFQGYIEKGRFCLCGMMAVELRSVSPRVRKLLDAYFADFEVWITEQFNVMEHKDAKTQSLRFLSALEGSLLLARLRDDPKIVRDAMKGFLII